MSERVAGLIKRHDVRQEGFKTVAAAVLTGGVEYYGVWLDVVSAKGNVFPRVASRVFESVGAIGIAGTAKLAWDYFDLRHQRHLQLDRMEALTYGILDRPSGLELVSSTPTEAALESQ